MMPLSSSKQKQVILSIFGMLISGRVGTFQSSKRGHLRERKSSKKLSNSSNDIRPPSDVLGDNSELFFVVSISLFDIIYSSKLIVK